MNTFLQTRKASYAAQRQASSGAGVTLVNSVGHFSASFDCAHRCSRVLGSREFSISEEVPCYKIPTEEVSVAIAKLAEHYSVALVEVIADRRDNVRFVMVWRVEAVKKNLVSSLNLDDY